MTTRRPGRSEDGHAQGRDTGTEGREQAGRRLYVDAMPGPSLTMLSRLSRTIEGEIVPKLLLDAGMQTGSAWRTPDNLTVRDSVDEFVDLLLYQSPDVAAQYVAALRSQGTSLPVIYLDLLSPAARRLGEMWETDEATFSDVTIGLCHMHQVLLEFSRCFDETRDAAMNGRSALIVPAPGEQHTFGLFIVIEFFRRAGWNCWSGTPRTRDELRELADGRDFDVIGLSVSAERNLDAIADHIGRLRNDTRNGDALILAGGQPFLKDPELARQLGADATAADGEQAVRTVNKMCLKIKGNGA